MWIHWNRSSFYAWMHGIIALRKVVGGNFVVAFLLVAFFWYVVPGTGGGLTLESSQFHHRRSHFRSKYIFSKNRSSRKKKHTVNISVLNTV